MPENVLYESQMNCQSLLSQLCESAFKLPVFNELGATFTDECLKKHLKKINSFSEKEDYYYDKIAMQSLELVREMMLKMKFTDGLAFDLLKAWQSYEDIIYLTRSSYRDHFMHQFYVFLLGTFFLDRLYLNVLKGKSHSERSDVTRFRLLRRWFLASIFHDIGYPAETLSDLKKTLHEKFFNKIPNFGVKDIEMTEFKDDTTVGHLFESISRIHLFSEFIQINEMLGELDPKYMVLHNLSIKELINLLTDEIKQTHDHGVTGAIFFLKTALIDLREMVASPISENTIRDEKLKFLIEDIYVAATAISGHNLRSKTYPGFTVDFDARPIGALLNFCDDFQEWDRRPHDHDWTRRRCILTKIQEINNDTISLEFETKGDPDIDDDVRINQRSLLDNLDHLFLANLSDEECVFYKKIQIKGFKCNKVFSAEIISNDNDSHNKGRYKTLRLEKDGKPAFCKNTIGDKCVRCGHLERINK